MAKEKIEGVKFSGLTVKDIISNKTFLKEISKLKDVQPVALFLTGEKNKHQYTVVMVDHSSKDIKGKVLHVESGD